MNKIKLLTCCVTIAALQASIVQAQLTWDVTTGDGVIVHTNGVWDTTTANWTTDDGASNEVWVDGTNAVFTHNTNNAQLVVDVDAGITVGDLTVSPSNGNGNVILRGLADNTQMTVAPGGATWALGGRYLETLNNTSQDLFLSMTAGDTLTVTDGGATGGTFDTGEKPTGATWLVDDCTLDFQAENGVFKGNNASVGRFKTVKFADNTTYVHDRNGNQTYANDWDLGTGTVTFQNRWANNGSVNLSGVVSGSGTWVIACNATRYVRPMSTNNTFSGTYIVGTANKPGAELLNYNTDRAYGPVPASVVSNYFTLVNGGELKLNGFEINANRGITLDGSGKIINNTGPTVYGGKITGDGQLIVGRNEGSDGNQLFLYSDTSDYTGGTRVWQGSLKIGIDNALPNDGVLTLGGGSKNGRFFMNGFDQTIGGLTVDGGNTREIVNNTTTNATLTFDVASGKTYNYPGNFNGSGEFVFVKEGEGTQRLTRGGGFSKDPISITVNAGIFEQSCGALSSPITVNSGGTLGGVGTTLSNVVVNSGGSLAPGNADGWNSLKFGATLDISGMIDDNAGGLQIGFGAAKDSIIVTNASDTAVLDMKGSGFFDLGFSDFTFTHNSNYELASGSYPILIADSINGNLDIADLTGDVGAYGATGTLALSNEASQVVIYLIVDGADTSPYGLWATSYGLETGDELGHADEDGYNNFQEFAYGGDPTNTADIGYAPVAGSSDVGGTNWLTLAYGYRSDTNSGISYECLTTDNLVIGSWTNAGITVLGTNTLDGTFDTITNAIPVDGTQDFLGVFLEK
ncbi:hypothetical protein P4B35_12105 [Pontiellaceae bacterium B12227]|nr:hypothetical protein [Pontiellaceae bacterium B12227]